ncbi:hypothetical protein PIROE2DRAFT_20596 [Piromyces sp. E2]|nr:hypothetical protein PIROE2DRAFT_20596 [Piromyces sp. E2]|eukprot:OUM63988.1 hypothetical protein PIROE2DRAFT_20596 [Piromyces sp. E2]
MINFEDLSIYYEDEDIKAFYDEYNTICNPNKLLEIAKRGILLYEPLDPLKLIHPYLVDISVLAHQNYMVSNIDQYNRIKTLIVSDLYDEYSRNHILNLLIINKTFIDFFIFDTEFIEFLMNNDKNDNFNNYNYVRIIHKLVEYGYVEETVVRDFFSQGILQNTSFLSTINDKLSSDSNSDNSLDRELLDVNMNYLTMVNNTQGDDILNTNENEVENCKEIIILHNFFYLNNRIEELLNIFNNCDLIDFESILNTEECEDILNHILDNKTQLNPYHIEVLNKSQKNTLLLENINDINLIYLFENNPNIFKKFDIHNSFEKFPTSFPIKIMQKYSHVFVNYENQTHFEYQNPYVGELMNGCKNDEFLDILSHFGFVNPDTLNKLPLYHRKYINNYQALLSFEQEKFLIQKEYENSYLPNLSLGGVPFLSL